MTDIRTPFDYLSRAQLGRLAMTARILARSLERTDAGAAVIIGAIATGADAEVVGRMAHSGPRVNVVRADLGDTDPLVVEQSIRYASAAAVNLRDANRDDALGDFWHAVLVSLTDEQTRARDEVRALDLLTSPVSVLLD